MSSEIRNKLSQLTDSLIESIDITTLSNSERIALLRILVGYTVPKLANEKPSTFQEERLFQEVQLLLLGRSYYPIPYFPLAPIPKIRFVLDS